MTSQSQSLEIWKTSYICHDVGISQSCLFFLVTADAAFDFIINYVSRNWLFTRMQSIGYQVKV